MKKEPVYIVSMIARSGSSMMMECLHKGGMSPVYSPEQDAQTEWGFYEMPYPIDSEFYEKHQGMVAKVPVQRMGTLPDGLYKVIFMRRNPHGILNSMEKLTQLRWGDEHDMVEFGYSNFVGMKIADMRAHGMEVTEIQYEDVLANPVEVFTRIAKAGWPIDPILAATVVKK